MKQAASLLVIFFIGALAAMPWFLVLIIGFLAPFLAMVFVLYVIYAWFKYVIFG